MNRLRRENLEVNNTINFSTIHLSQISWKFSNFNELTTKDLYEALALRESIFIVEQNVPYLDIDGKDINCTHLLGCMNNEVVAYMRIVPIDMFEKGFLSIGRVVVRRDLRKFGVGRNMVRLALNYLHQSGYHQPIKISSQLYLKEFYESFGFTSIGEPYIEDQIPHIAMVKN